MTETLAVAAIWLLIAGLLAAGVGLALHGHARNERARRHR